MKNSRFSHISGFGIIFLFLIFSLQCLEHASQKANKTTNNIIRKKQLSDLNDFILTGTIQKGTYIILSDLSYQKINNELFFDENRNDITITKIVSISKNEHFFISKNKGIIYTDDGLNTFKKLNNGLPKKRIVIDGRITENLYQEITSFAIDTENNNNIFLTTKYAIYRTKNKGLNWEFYSNPPGYYNNLTSIAFSSKYGFLLLLGTAYNGLFYQNKENGQWYRLNNGLKMNGGIVEEIGSIKIDTKNSLNIFCGHNFGNKLFILDKNSLSFIKNNNNTNTLSLQNAFFREIKLPFKQFNGSIEILNDIADIDISYYKNQRQIVLLTTYGIVAKKDDISDWHRIHLNDFFNNFHYYNEITSISKIKNGEILYSLNKFQQYLSNNKISKKSKYFHKAKSKRGYYIQSHVAIQAERLNKIIKSLKENGYNMITIDLKDDFGHVNYNSNLEIVKKVGSNNGFKINIKKFLQIMKDNNIYVVARIVVFKDPILFEYKNNKYTIYDTKRKNAWKGYIISTNNKQIPIKEKWLDPFSHFVWEYNISIAKELEELGVDEIQFDYIRFPTDGENTEDMYFRYKHPEQQRSDAIESFLALARKKLNIPISVDIYGANGWNRMGNKLGQDIEMLSEYVDVICPMFYPSHFHPDFSNIFPYEEKPYRIYFYGTLRSLMMTNYKVEIRSYVQAFKLNNNSYDKKYYNKNYIAYQIIGIEDANNEAGYTFWNSSSKYNIIKKANKIKNALLKNTGIRRQNFISYNKVK